LQQLHDLGSEVGTFFLTTNSASTPAADPYSQAVAGWISIPVYAMVSVGDYLLMACSGLVWLALGWTWLRGSRRPGSQASWLLWLLYAAFALQGAASILLDRRGLLGNLEHRSFPSFAMVATPVLAMWLCQLRPRLPLRLLGGVACAVLAGLAILKAANEPSLSNKWSFYTPAELQALAWADQHNQGVVTWVGADERLRTAFQLVTGNPTNHNDWDAYAPKPGTRSFLISDVIRLQATRLGRPLPRLDSEYLAYDSGSVQIYRLRPRTPHQS
jgi:hypothetical protein